MRSCRRGQTYSNNSNFKCDKITPDRHTFRQTHSDRHIPTDTFRQTHSECLVKMFCGTGVSPRTRINKFDRRKNLFFLLFVPIPLQPRTLDFLFFCLFLFVCFFQFHSILVMRLMPLLTKSMGSRPRTL